MRNKKVQAAIYLRVSTSKITSYQSIDSQRQITLSELKRHPDFNFVGEYVDLGVSGTSTNRKELLRLLDDIKLGKVEVVIVKDMSRLARNHLEVSKLLENELSNTRVIFVNEGLDTSSSNSTLIAMRNLINDKYSVDLSSKVKSSLYNLKRSGKVASSKIPFGYQKQNSSLVINSKEAEIVKEIFNLKSLNYSYSYLLEYLNHNYPSYHFTYNKLKHIISNEVYIGNYYQNKYSKPLVKSKKIISNPKEAQLLITVTPLVKVETFHSANSKFKYLKPNHENKYDTYLPLLKCDICQSSMIKIKYKNEYYLNCNNYVKKGNCLNHKIKLAETKEKLIALVNDITKIKTTLEEVEASLKLVNQKLKKLKNHKLEITLEELETLTLKYSKEKETLTTLKTNLTKVINNQINHLYVIKNVLVSSSGNLKINY